MPRIRKKTSNRGSTNERKKILHKVRESRRKKVKAAKKNPQWVSKQKKDPGIPNNFPFKEQILAEVAEQRRLAAEEKQRKKSEKKGGKSKDVEDTDEVDLAAQDAASGFDGVASISAKRVQAKTFRREAPVVEEAEVEEEIPILINHDLPHLQAVCEQSDVVIEVLDCKNPLAFRSSHLEELVSAMPGKRIMLVLNKIDTCPRETVSSWAAHLRTEHPTFLFRAASSFMPHEILQPSKGQKAKAKEPEDDAVGVDSVLACLGKWAQAKKGDGPLSVAVVGVTNVGKSTFINSLARKAALPIYTLATSSRGPTTTTLPQEVSVEVASKEIRFIDTPGWSWETEESEELSKEAEGAIRGQDILMRNKGRIDRLKDPTLPVDHIVARANNEDLMLLYSLPAFIKGDTDAFLSGLARSQQLIKKKGALDLTGACRIVLRDWSTGRFKWYTTPPPSSEVKAVSKKASVALAGFYAADDDILSTLQPRKDLRKSGGLVKFLPGQADPRKVAVDEPYHKPEAQEDGSDEDADEDVVMGDELEGAADDDDGDEDIEEDEEEEDEEDDEPPPPPIVNRKQKRKLTVEAAALPPSKKVAFAQEPKDTKKSRSLGSQKPKAEKRASLKPKAPEARAKKTQKGANVPKTAQPKSSSQGDGADDAYDFGKFF